MTVCAIHQPNFFPWLGYFDKIRRADVFVFLDDVAYPKSGSGSGSWVNRVRIPINNTPAWITCPIRREHGVQIIRDVKIDDSQPWRRKLLRTFEITYARAPNFERVMPVMEQLVMFETDNLSQFNVHAIKRISELIGIESKFVEQSTLTTEDFSTALLIEIIKKVGADTYLCGGGADGYQDDALFAGHGINLVYQNFIALPYGDMKGFHPGMSSIDFLMTTEHRYEADHIRWR